MSSFSRSRPLTRTSYSNPPSRSGSRSQTPVRSRSGSLERPWEPSSYSAPFAKPISRASSLQSLPSADRNFLSSSLSPRSPVTPSLNRYKSASITGLSTPSSYSQPFSFRQQPTFNTYNRYSPVAATTRPTSLVDIRRPPTIDRYQQSSAYGTGRYGAAPPVVPSYSRYQPRSSSPAPALKYFGPTPYLSTLANQQGVGAYTKLLRYSFGYPKDRTSDTSPTITTSRNSFKDRSSDTSPAINTRNSYFEVGRTTTNYRTPAGTSSSYYGSSRTTYGSSISRHTDSDDKMDLYKTRFQPTGAMSKYWTSPRKLFVGRDEY